MGQGDVERGDAGQQLSRPHRSYSSRSEHNPFSILTRSTIAKCQKQIIERMYDIVKEEREMT